MSRGSYKRRVDDNQQSMVKLFRQMGCKVKVLSAVGDGFPDLLILCAHKLHLVEIKDGRKPLSQQTLTEDQKKFHEEWGETVSIISNSDEALNLVKLMRGIPVGLKINNY